MLLPEFSGGMENVTTTFLGEAAGQANPNFVLSAHELSHHWFGDWVTVEDFDDLWIKEGMATLLGVEADRARRDAEGTGRLFGYPFSFAPADSIRDKQLVGLDKYTTGPYRRAAWLLTQIRANVGEASFWQSARDVLGKYALGSIDSERFVRSFALGENTIQKVLASLDRKDVPEIAITTAPNGTDTSVTLTLSDPGRTMIAPLRVSVVDAEGRATGMTLQVDVPLTVIVPAGGYMAPDEEDVHPDWFQSFAVDADAYGKLASLFIPTSAPALSAFETRSAAHQERALGWGASFLFEPVTLSDFYRNLDSIPARRSAELDACVTLKNEPAADWAPALASILSSPSLSTWSAGYANCGTDLATRLFGAELSSLATAVDATTASRFIYLSSFDYGVVPSFDAFSTVATHAPSLQLREQAVTRLATQADPNGGYSALSADQVPAWKDFFRARLAETTSSTRFRIVWRGVTALGDDGALTLAGEKLQTVRLPADLQRQVVCDAYAIAQARAGAWIEFQIAAQPWEALAPLAKAVLENPTGCST